MPQPYQQVADKFSMYSPQGLHRAAFSHFQKAGIDLFSDPLSQNPDGFLQLSNVLPSMTGGFNRRWGTTSLGSVPGIATGNPVARMFPYQVSAEGAIAGDYYSGFANYYALLATDNASVVAIYNEGTNDAQSMTGFVGTGQVYGTLSRDFFYAFDGVSQPIKKNFAKGDAQTAIGINSISTDEGRMTGGVGIIGAGSGISYNPGTTTATLVDTSGAGSGAAIALQFNSQGMITGATVTAAGLSYNPSTTTIVVHDTSGVGSGGLLVPEFDTNGAVINALINGPMVFNVGRKYVVVGQSSKTGHTSDIPYYSDGTAELSALAGSGSTSAVANGYVNLGYTNIQLTISFLVSSLDPQIDTILLLATSDGGDEEHLYLVSSFPLADFTISTVSGAVVYSLTNPYLDIIPDTYANNQAPVPVKTLLEQNLYSDLDAYGNTVGILGNELPPVSLNKPIVYQGRLFATDGKTVFYSKSLAEVTTSTGLITSKWEECWPAANRFDIGFDNEVITGLLSDSSNLYIGTTQNIYRLSGTDINSFYLQVLFRNVGLLSQDSWSVVYKEFMPAGYMWVTPDLKIMLSDFNSYRDIGTPIYPLLSGLTAGTEVYIQPWTNGPYSLALLKSTALQGMMVFNLKEESWYEWNAQIGNGPICSYTNSKGLVVPFFTLPAPTPVPLPTPPIYFIPHNVLGFFDTTQSVDAFPIPNTPIYWTVQTGWQDLGDSTPIKVVNELECWSEEPALNTQILSLTSAMSATTVTNSRACVPAPTQAMNGLYKAYYAGAPTAGKLHSFVFTGPSNTTSTVSSVLSQFVVDAFPFGRF